MKTLLIVMLICCSLKIFPQQWTLESCIKYATDHHVQIKEADLQKIQSDLNVKQAKLSLLPDLQATFGNGFQGGRTVSVDNTGFITQVQGYANMGVQTSIEIFNFFSKRNTILSNIYTQLAQQQNINRTKLDIKLKVIQTYLQAMLSYQQIKMSELLIMQNLEQIIKAKKNVSLGNYAESNIIELQSQLVHDSVQWISYKNTYQENILQLQLAMNMDMSQTIDISAQEDMPINEELLTHVANPNLVYQNIKKTHPLLLFNDYKIKAFTKDLHIAQAKLLPRISLSAGINTNAIYFPEQNKTIGEGNIQSVNLPIGYIENQTQRISVYSLNPVNIYDTYRAPKLNEQLQNNYNFSTLLTLNIPIFQSWANKLKVKTQELNIKTQTLQKQADEYQLEQNVYKLCVSIQNLYQKWLIYSRAKEWAELAYKNAQKRLDLNHISITDFITVHNNLGKTQLESLLLYYELIFKQEVLKAYE